METFIIPLYLSLKVASLATFFSFILGTSLAWIFAFRQNKWTHLLSLMINIPLIIPPTVLGYYLLLLIGRNSLLGSWYEALIGQPLVFTWKAAVIAATIAALPLLVRPIQAAFESIQQSVIEAAAIDGANQWNILLKVVLPLSFKGILAGLILGFARSMGEFGATLMVAGNIPGQTQTMSIAIYDAVQAGRMTDAHLMVILLSVLTISLLLVINRWLSK